MTQGVDGNGFDGEYRLHTPFKIIEANGKRRRIYGLHEIYAGELADGLHGCRGQRDRSFVRVGRKRRHGLPNGDLYGDGGKSDASLADYIENMGRQIFFHALCGDRSDSGKLLLVYRA